MVEHQGVRIVGLTNPPAEMATHASFMYSNNVVKLLALFGAKGQLNPDWSDEIVIGVTLARGGRADPRRHRRSARRLPTCPSRHEVKESAE